MRYERGQRRSSKGFAFNLTPMVDVIFILTIFFMLVSRFSSAEQVPMEVPKPYDSKARTMKIPERVTINCRPSRPADPAAGEVLYSIGPNQPTPLSVVAERLSVMKAQSPEMKAVIRADRRLHYADVRVLMRVIAQNDIEMLNVVAHVAEEE